MHACDLYELEEAMAAAHVLASRSRLPQREETVGTANEKKALS